MKETKIVRGRNTYLYDVESVISVQSIKGGLDLINFSFDIETKKLSIYDSNYSRQDYQYGKEYRIFYLKDKAILREEQLKKILQ